MQHFSELDAWKNGLELVQEIYSISKLLPKEELFGITSQIRRASTSILANIAEGFSRFTFADKAAKYTISRGECSEVEAFLLLIVALALVPQDRTSRALELTQRERRLLSGLVQACRLRA